MDQSNVVANASNSPINTMAPGYQYSGSPTAPVWTGNPAAMPAGYQPYNKQAYGVQTGDPAALWKQAYGSYIGSMSGTPPQQVPYAGIVDPATGQLYSQYQLSAQPNVSYNSNLNQYQQMLNGNNLDTSGIDAMKAYATGTGDSPWATLQRQLQQSQQAQAQNQLTQQLSGQAAGARSALAASGGATAASRAMLARSAELGGLTANQNLAQAGQQAQLGIGTQDEQNRLQMLSQLPSAELGAAQFGLSKTNDWGNMANATSNAQMQADLSNRQYQTGVQQSNINNLIQNQMGQNAYNQNQWQGLMDQWKAAMQAGAQLYG